MAMSENLKKLSAGLSSRIKESIDELFESNKKLSVEEKQDIIEDQIMIMEEVREDLEDFDDDDDDTEEDLIDDNDDTED